MQYQYYEPHPHICRMKQYECCKNYHNCCPLYHTCKGMKGYAEASKVCKRDCATCDYTGCSMPEEQRKTDPLYVNGLITTEPLPIPIERERERERRIHIVTHRKNYEFYNKLFGDLKERRNKKNRDRYHADPEFHRQRAREWYHAHYVKQEKIIPEAIMPDCKLDCEHCPHSDCILPEDWRKRANLENWNKANPTYHADYRENHRELLREKGKQYYAENREEKLRRLKEYRSKPEVKAQRAAYDKDYRRRHPDKSKERKQRYRQRHPERIKEQKRKYYEAHKDEINAKRREKYGTRKSFGNLAHC